MIRAFQTVKNKLVLITIILIVGLSIAAFLYKRSVNQDLIKLNNIVIDKVKKEIRIKSKLAIRHGILEFFLVTIHGNTYESVLKVDDNKPSDLNFAIQLLGIEPAEIKDLQNALNRNYSAKKFLAAHPNCALSIEMLHKGKSVDFYKVIKCQEEIPRTDLWIYTGSFFSKKNRYVADLANTYISIWPDQAAVINLYSSSRNPYEGENYGFRMRGDHIYKADDEFEIVIRRYNVDSALKSEPEPDPKVKSKSGQKPKTSP
ncbi:MAG: hypothetical protein GY874_04255 [Desulfobacteraceae bacterium]|nr:hypothetical protein [Desulfobacteraceae bacterium]